MIIDSQTVFETAANTRELKVFLELIFPAEWASISARILESGATMSNEPVRWAPRWTPISPTVRVGKNPLETSIKSCLYRAHDSIHQLWGLPIPSLEMSEDDFFLYKRAQMCGEVAVLALTEFALAESIAKRFPELREFLNTRNALVMWSGPLSNKSVKQVACRLDELLHKKINPRWVRENEAAKAFVKKYVPMLESDRFAINNNWEIMKAKGFHPSGLPNARYSSSLSGLELTTWMIEDFYHLLDTDPVVDTQLANFNKQRRANIKLPEGWK